MASATGYQIGFKPAGGLQDRQGRASNWLILMKEELGRRWLEPDLFRIGASSMLADIERQLEHYVTGRYAAAYPPRRSPEDDTWPSIKDILDTMDYGPAPEAQRPRARPGSKPTRTASAISSTARSSPRRRQDSSTSPIRRPATSCSPACAQGTAADVDAAVAAARKAFKPGRRCPGHERARHLYAHRPPSSRSASASSPCWRRWTTASRSARARDIDIPLVARHFYHHAGWAELIDDEFPGYRPGRRLRPDHPVELPAADAGLEDRAGARRRQHGGAEARRVHAADRARLRRDLPRGGPAAGRRQHRHRRRRRPARRSSTHPGVDKIAFTGSTEVGRIIRKATAGSGKKLSLELGGKSPFIVFDDADLDAAVEGVVDAIWFNQGQVCCAGSRLLVQEGIAERFYAKLRAPHGDAARRRSARQVDRHRRHRRRRPAGAHHARWSRRARPRAARCCQPSTASCPAPATSSRRRCSPTSSPPRP